MPLWWFRHSCYYIKYMNTEYEKMLAGEEYFAADDELIVLLNECKDACWESMKLT